MEMHTRAALNAACMKPTHEMNTRGLRGAPSARGGLTVAPTGASTARAQHDTTVEPIVYPNGGHFRNSVPFSNIEKDRPTPPGFGMTPRCSALRICPGTPLIMQPITKPAQSTFPDPQRHGVRAGLPR
jgi:hypothetical protein